MTFLAVLPSIYPPYTEACVHGMATDLTDRLMVIDNTTRNRGVAASWNIAARRVLDLQRDWLVVVSAATRFGPPGGRDFLAELDVHPDALVVESAGGREGTVVGWHLIAWSRELLETIGLFDENFWPAYGEDMDMSWRVNVTTNADRGEPSRWDKVPVDAWVESVNHGARLAGVALDQMGAAQYLARKWGGNGEDLNIPPDGFRVPFDEPGRDLSYWPRPPEPRCLGHLGWPEGVWDGHARFKRLRDDRRVYFVDEAWRSWDEKHGWRTPGDVDGEWMYVPLLEDGTVAQPHPYQIEGFAR